MTGFRNVVSGIFLLTLFLMVGFVCAADTDANLSIAKVVSSAAPYETGQPVTWVVTLLNNGPADATNISLAEDLSGFSGRVNMSGTADLGTYDNASRTWNISRLNNASSAHLRIITVFDSTGHQTNTVTILGLDQANPGNTHASQGLRVINNAGAVIPDQPLKVNLIIKPNTLNLKSKGVFTVFITLNGGDSPFPVGMNSKPRIDFGNSSLACDGAEMVSAGVSNKDGGTLIAKFHRQDLENVTSGSGVQINCSGTFSVNGKSVDVEGSDTIRVIGEKKGLDKFISGLMKYLGLEKDDIAVNETGDGNVTVSFTLNPDLFRNNGQMKKALKNVDTTPAPTDNTRNASDKSTDRQDTVKNNGKDKNNNGKDNQVLENNAGKDKKVQGNNKYNNGDKGNDASNGKSNGKKTT